MKIKKGAVSLALVSTFLGLLLTTSFYTWQRTQETTSISRKRELIQVIRELEKKRNLLKEELADARGALNLYEKRAAAREGKLGTFSKELDGLKEATGLTEVQGEGLEITLDDSPEIPLGKDPNNYIIHDYDIRTLVNALWSSGAKAIAINTQRLMPTGSIRCVGNTVLVNAFRLGTPYRIKVVGNPQRLEKGLKDDEEASQLIETYAKMFGLVVEVKKKNKVKVPAYEGSLEVKYAKPVKE